MVGSVRNRIADDAAVSRRGHAAAVACRRTTLRTIPAKLLPVLLRRVVVRLGLSVPACAIMNDHVHFLVWRSKYTIEYLVNQLKGAATLDLGLDRTALDQGLLEGVSSMTKWRCGPRRNTSRPTRAAAGLKPQRWAFVTPLPPDT